MEPKEKNPILVEAGKKGGYIRWSKVKPKDRSKIMSGVAKARYDKKNPPPIS